MAFKKGKNEFPSGTFCPGKLFHRNDRKSRVQFAFQPDFLEWFCKWQTSKTKSIARNFAEVLKAAAEPRMIEQFVAASTVYHKLHVYTAVGRRTGIHFVFIEQAKFSLTFKMRNLLSVPS